MQIVLVGAQCVGKTTLIKELAKDYPDDIIVELIRTCARQNSNVKVNENGNDESQYYFFDKYVEALNERENFIADRSMFDVVAYTKIMYDYGNVTLDTLETLYSRLVDFLNSHPKIQHYHIPPMFPIVADGFRSVSLEFQQHAEAAINWLDARLRSDENVRHYNLFTTQNIDVEKRLDEIYAMMENR